LVSKFVVRPKFLTGRSESPAAAGVTAHHDVTVAVAFSGRVLSCWHWQHASEAACQQKESDSDSDNHPAAGRRLAEAAGNGRPSGSLSPRLGSQWQGSTLSLSESATGSGSHDRVTAGSSFLDSEQLRAGVGAAARARNLRMPLAPPAAGYYGGSSIIIINDPSRAPAAGDSDASGTEITRRA
jgi:hypothetical protein